MGEPFFFFIFASLLVLILLVINFIVVPIKDKQYVYAHLAQMGASDVTVKRHWLSGGTHHRAYAVSYRDSNGARQNNGCIVLRSLWRNPQIYWLGSASPNFEAVGLTKSRTSSH